MTTQITDQQKPVEKMYCSLVSEENKEDPIGTAAKHERYLFIEVRYPWESKVEESKHFPEGLDELMKKMKEDGRKCRLQAFNSEKHASLVGQQRIIFYEQPAESFARYEKKEYIIPDEEVLAFTEAIVMGEKSLESFAKYEQKTDNIRDIFVCTHGSRDRCCGKFGFQTYDLIKEKYASDELRVWRLSHMGGHRHAPTLADFPEGRYWAHVTEETLEPLLLRKGTFKQIANNYRGWGGVRPFAQVIERELFIQKGWDWLDYEKTATITEHDKTSAHVRFECKSPDGNTQEIYEADITAKETVLIGGCGNDLKEEKQYKIERLEKL